MDIDKSPPPAHVRFLTAEEIRAGFGLTRDHVKRATEIRQDAEQRLRDHVASTNKTLAPATGQFEDGARLTFKVGPNGASLPRVVAEMMGVPDPAMLTRGNLDGLIQVNPDLAKELTRLRDALGKNELPAADLKGGTVLVVRSPESLRFEMIQARAVGDMLRSIPEKQLNDNGRTNRNNIVGLTNQIVVHKEAQALGLEIERDDIKLARSAELGSIPVVTKLNPRLRTLEDTVQRARDFEFPAEQIKDLEGLERRARAQSVANVVDVSERASLLAEMQGKGDLAIRHLAAAREHADKLPEKAKREAEIAEIRTQARNLLPRTFAVALVRGDKVEDLVGSAKIFFDAPEIDVVLAQSHLKAAVLTRNASIGNDAAPDPHGKLHYEAAENAYLRTLNQLGYKTDEAIPRGHRALALEASSYLLEKALTERKVEDVKSLLEYQLRAIKSVPAEAAAEAAREQEALKVRLARAVFEEPGRYSEAAELLGVKGMSEKDARANLLTFVKDRVKTIAEEREATLKDATAVEKQLALAQELGETQIALSRMLVCGLVSLRDDSVKQGYYDDLDALNKAILTGERETIGRLRDDVTKLERTLADGGPGLDRESIEARIEVLKREREHREIAAASLLVQQAEAALHADVGDLRYKAKELVAQAAEFSPKNEKILKLVAKFKDQNEPGPLIAATTEFLSEVNKDYPPYVLAAMIGAGLLGAYVGYKALHSKEAAAYGFLAASCATLLATKLYYTAAGMPDMVAAAETGLSPHSGSQNFLNVLYLGADLLQMAPLIPAAIGLRRLARKQRELGAVSELVATPPDEEKVKTVTDRALEVLSVLGHEAVAFGKGVLSLADPRTLTFWFVATTIGVGSWQVMGSDIPDKVKEDLMTRLGLEVATVLAFAIALDMSFDKIAGKKKKDEDGERSEQKKEGIDDAATGTSAPTEAGADEATDQQLVDEAARLLNTLEAPQPSSSTGETLPTEKDEERPTGTA